MEGSGVPLSERRVKEMAGKIKCKAYKLGQKDEYEFDIPDDVLDVEWYVDLCKSLLRDGHGYFRVSAKVVA